MEGERGVVVGRGDVDHDQAGFEHVHIVDRFHDRHDAPPWGGGSHSAAHSPLRERGGTEGHSEVKPF
ncbi:MULTISPECIES: hypothetical protein [unclassified Streptomyces]|uniref:hypothetical protein n=1 Tax=unclassified Streptomyces TaxID=2593676 RepID=UPI003077F39F